MHGCNAGVMSVQTDPQVRLYNYWLDTKYTGLVFPLLLIFLSTVIFYRKNLSWQVLMKELVEYGLLPIRDFE